ncbi:DUF418 domain-containing protein [Azospirillum lipoferum]|uniref:DUF418 domain-containing protein n=1 Tax=Azospirillum lipoferum (strain 4B) TaxID=862719 RepID=G7Z2L1_AZOL4|nr:DUF418 domain-containing protein [Azospirillum lipoferum]CBS87606.1 conserved membrane protein of unknown function [Azospirillum lipoferum 4B]
MSDPVSPAPVAAVHRIADVDALRGAALFGILIVNIQAFASAVYGTGVADPAFQALGDRLIRLLVSALAEMKFYLLFSFLFGYSFTLQMAAAERAGEPLTGRMLRRQAGLLVIGLAHGVLLFHGDILTIYALLGLVLLAMRGGSDSRALRVAVWLIGIGGCLWLALGLLQWWAGGTIDRAAVVAEALAAQRDYRGDPLTIIARRWDDLTQVWVALLAIQAPSALAMFLLGFVAGRRELLRSVQRHGRLFRRILWLGLLIGLPGMLAKEWLVRSVGDAGGEAIGLGVSLLTAPMLSAAYGTAILLGFQTERGRIVAGWLAPAGRMALTNYLSQSLVCALLFTGYGAGLIGRLPPAACCGIALSLFAAQLVWSRWWLGRFAYGPVEWVLRALTIARRPSWRRPTAPVRS